jgi:hypothetical protein
MTKQGMSVLLILFLIMPLGPWSQSQGTAIAEASPVVAAAMPSMYFPETGHHVRGAFNEFFARHGGAPIIGYPLTEAFIQGGRRIQIFEHLALARDLTTSGQVRPVAISLRLKKVEPAIPASLVPEDTDESSRYYAATGHLVVQPFLGFFQDAGGEDLFGYPVTQVRIEKGRVVQYFENARLEWNEQARQVEVSSLARVYLQSLDLPPSLTAPVDPTLPPRRMLATPTLSLTRIRPATATSTISPTLEATPIPTVNTPSAVVATAATAEPKTLMLPLIMTVPEHNLVVDAYVKYPQAGQGGQQTVYVAVRDWQGKPVEDAKVQLTAHQGTDIEAQRSASTGPEGRVGFRFSIEPAGDERSVIVDLCAWHGAARGLAQVAFAVRW